MDFISDGCVDVIGYTPDDFINKSPPASPSIECPAIRSSKASHIFRPSVIVISPVLFSLSYALLDVISQITALLGDSLGDVNRMCLGNDLL